MNRYAEYKLCKCGNNKGWTVPFRIQEHWKNFTAICMACHNLTKIRVITK